jgi:hypothetical protein
MKVELPDILDQIEIDKTTINPNDVIIIKFKKDYIDPKSLQYLYNFLDKTWFPNNKVLCMESSLNIGTIPKEELERLLKE